MSLLSWCFCSLFPVNLLVIHLLEIEKRTDRLTCSNEIQEPLLPHCYLLAYWIEIPFRCTSLTGDSGHILGRSKCGHFADSCPACLMPNPSASCLPVLSCAMVATYPSRVPWACDSTATAPSSWLWGVACPLYSMTSTPACLCSSLTIRVTSTLAPWKVAALQGIVTR